jgi:hypothetical protein
MERPQAARADAFLCLKITTSELIWSRLFADRGFALLQRATVHKPCAA